MNSSITSPSNDPGLAHFSFTAQNLQGTRTYRAARAGLEWGIGTVVASPGSGGATPPGCPTTPTTSTTTIGTTFDGGFTVTVKCQRADYMEGAAAANRFIFQLTSEAKITGGSVGSVGYIERSVSASMECVKNEPVLTYSCG